MVPPWRRTAPGEEQGKPDLRSISFQDRQALRLGPTVKIFDDTMFVVEVPRALFLAATDEPRLIQEPEGEVHLPPNTGKASILTVCCWLLVMLNEPEPFNMRARQELTADLLICRAGRLLGMEKYIDHIHRHYWWRFYNLPFGAYEITAVLEAAFDHDDPFLRLVSEILAEHLRDENRMGGESLRAFIASLPMLENTVGRAQQKWESKMKIKTQKEERVLRRARREKILEEKMALALKQMVEEELKELAEIEEEKNRKEEREKKSLEREQREKEKWAERSRKDSELHKSLQEKILAGKKTVTREEARYYERNRGKRCPYKIV